MVATDTLLATNPDEIQELRSQINDLLVKALTYCERVYLRDNRVELEGGQAEEFQRLLEPYQESGIAARYYARMMKRSSGVACHELVAKYPSRRPIVIDGILRKGEVMNVIGAPKVGKSWFIYGLLLCVASGSEWLGFKTSKGRVLLLDNELHREELAYRISRVAEAMELSLAEIGDNFMIESVRGNPCGIGDIDQMLRVQYGADDFSLIALDAFYRLLPQGSSENDNAAMTQLYNQIDVIAARADAPIVLNHHTSKGDQSAKGVTDVGAGAGAMTRATDTHLIMRPHELEGCVVMEAVCRSFRPPEPATLCFEWPTWSVRNIEPTLRKPNGSAEAKQTERDKEADHEVLEVLADGKKRPKAYIDENVTFGRDRCKNALNRLVKANRVSKRYAKSKTNGRKIAIYRRIHDKNEATTTVD